MKITIIPTKKQLIILSHLIFWFVSFNFWYVILNPGVESTTVIQGLEIEWGSILLINLLLLIYCFLPFIWLFKKAKWWLKLPFTILFLIPIVYVVMQSINPNGDKDDVAFFVAYFVKNFLYVVVFHSSIATAVYFNLKVLLVKYLNQVHLKTYLLYFTGLCMVTAFVNFAFFDLVIDQLFPELYYLSYFRIWELGLIVAGYLLFTSALALIWQYTQLLVTNRDAARNQLSALKAQINPHFLFNNLNTIYSLASQKDERASEVILKLSDFLRYILYDTSAETIPLEKEIEIIQSYVELQKERIDQNFVRVNLVTEGHFENVQIAPLLLLPLAENCFKHGIGKDQGFITIFIGFDGEQLTFKTENQVAPRERTNSENNGGIGLINVEKRLNLIYPEKYSLEYQNKNKIFKLELRIELKCP